jgi:hypothetical protein
MVKMACERELWVFIAVAPTTPVTQNMQHIQLALGTHFKQEKHKLCNMKCFISESILSRKCSYNTLKWQNCFFSVFFHPSYIIPGISLETTSATDTIQLYIV